MARTQAQYINMNLAKLANYINHLVAFNEKYNEGIEDLYSKSNTEYITKSKEVIEYEKDIKKSYDKAIELYKDLKRIAQNYEWGMNIDYDLQMFHSRFNSARLPIYEKVTLKLETPKHDETVTGGAADIHEIPDATEETLQDEPQKVLYGGIRYCHYTNDTEDLQGNDDTCNLLNKDNTDFYAEGKEEENEGYTGDSMELAAEYKRKYDEEHEKKAEEFARQQAAKQSQQIQKTKQNPQSPSENWIMPCNGRIVGYYGEKRSTHIHNGIDIAVPIGTHIKAVADGIVVEARNADGYGKFVVIEHNINGKIVTSEYGHILCWTVSKSQKVKQGQIVALSGNEGHSHGPHCHLTLRTGKYQGRAIDPKEYIKY